MKTLRDLVKDLGADRDVRKITLEQYDRSARYFSNFIGREANPGDLLESRVNLWTQSLQSKLDPVTVKNYLRGLLVLWSYAASLEIVNGYQRSRIRKPKIPQKPVKAWDESAVSAIIRAAGSLSGSLRNGCPIATYMKAYVLVAADTMLRPSDIRRLEWNMIEGLRLRIVQSKTGLEVVRPLRSVTLSALADLRKFSPPQGIFWLTHAGTRRHEIKVRRAAGVWENRRALGKLRHAGATKIADTKGMDAAAMSLGHAPGSVMAAKFYVVRKESGPSPWSDAS